MRPRLNPGQTALARYRPTPLQAASWGAWRGLAVGAGMVFATLGVAVGVRSGWGMIAAVVVPVVGGVVVGTAGGLLRGPRVGVEADDIGLHRRPPAPPAFVDWTQITDIRAERRGFRTMVAVHLGSGLVSRLPAPYDGRWLGADPQFEWKLFTLRNLWETHRSWRP